MMLNYKGTSVFYEDAGQGPAVVLLHGFLENTTVWDSLKEQLLMRYRVITIDLLGHGKTGCVGYVHTMETMADAVKAVINKLKLRRISLIGHSMGGYVALAYAEAYPDEVKALILANSTASADSPEKKKNRDRAIKMVKKDYKSFVRMGISNLFRPKNRKIFSEEIKELKKEALKTPVQGIVAALEGMKIRKDREILLHFTPFAKMMIIGKKDPVLLYEDLRAQVQNTDMEVVEFPDGHMSFIENKSQFIDKIKVFLNNI
ncbi:MULTISPECIES: alpha/beta fold hydrolase [Galbibacter]|uniref:Alpha/beta hydrolase n=1 Tax=Galbibacter pacificus TaxID=2996052 RepID=A0ABT6FU28_9FLAO|nr:alpha/beta hydrolase [Galbibacter pacificus]MDG3583291.1 alpha/beta hydrolase [Galbibacter pacificus]MDG3586772.1 alpha/beta hydrolase [Galbibacter pacificus]